MVGVPIGTDDYVLARAIEVVRDGGADHLARCFSNIPDKKAVALVTIESLEQRTTHLEWALDTGLYLEACRRVDNWAQWAYEKSWSYRERKGNNHFSRRCARGISCL